MPPRADPARMTTVRTVMTQLVVARHARGMTQQQLAEKMDTSVLSISHWENGHSDPLLSSVVAYARAVGLNTLHLDL